MLTAQRPDGGIDEYVLDYRSGIMAHTRINASGVPVKTEDLPGVWIALASAGYDGQDAYVEGYGTTRKKYRNTFPVGGTAWKLTELT